MTLPVWIGKAVAFLQNMRTSTGGAYASVPGGVPTLYGTCYGLLSQYYLGRDSEVTAETQEFILSWQDPDSGLFIGPELQNCQSTRNGEFDLEHLSLHLTCAALPACLNFNLQPRYSVRFARKFCELPVLGKWLARRDWRNAWLEGNNLLFVGQLLIYLRDVEHNAAASDALEVWFRWLDEQLDPNTGLWGTNGFCSDYEAVYGGYHQLLCYYHEGRPIRGGQELIDTCLGLQHRDGGFNPYGNGGACEDVDCVDILVNVYKRCDHRRSDVRRALRRCMRHILDLQNGDGGFPYNRDMEQSHMGIPATKAPANCSTMFATWFRVHTLALIAQILPGESTLRDVPFRFSRFLSMGWHETWNQNEHAPGPKEWLADAVNEGLVGWRCGRSAVTEAARTFRQRTKRRLGDIVRRSMGRA